MSRGFPLQFKIFMLQQISAFLTRTIASVPSILQPFYSYYYMLYFLHTKITTKNTGNTFLHFSSRFPPLNRRRIKERGEEGCERKWLAKRMKDTEGEIKGIADGVPLGVACRSVSPAHRPLPLLKCFWFIQHVCKKLNTSTGVFKWSTHTYSYFLHRPRCSSILCRILLFHACLYTQTSVTVPTSDIGRSVYKGKGIGVP
jgi:hypothetical protein